MLFLGACSEEFQPRQQEVEREAVILAELEVGKLVELQITSTFDRFSPTDQPIFPTQEDLGPANVPFLSNLSPNGPRDVSMRYQTESQTWVPNQFLFNAGEPLSLSADLSVIGLENSFAETTPPIPGEISTHSDVAIDTGDNLEFSIELTLPESEESFYHIKPFIAESANSAIKEYFNFDLSTPGESGLFVPSHIDGILIDIDRTDNMRQFDFTIDKSELSSNPSNIYLQVRTVAKEYYDFHVSVTLQEEAGQLPFDEPFVIESNIEGGQGLFTAFTVTLDSIQVE